MSDAVKGLQFAMIRGEIYREVCAEGTWEGARMCGVQMAVQMTAAGMCSFLQVGDRG